MWVYGIRLFLTDSIKEAKSSAFDYDIIQTFLSNASNGKRSQASEIAKRVFDDKQEIMRNYREKVVETLASGSRHDECINKIERGDNEKKFSNCGDNYEQSDATECKNGIARNSETNHTNCGENYESTNADETCMDNKTKSKRETKSSLFNYKDFIQTFLSNASNGKMSQEPDMTKMFEFCNKFDNNELVNNDQFYQKILGTLTSDSNHFKCKNEIAKRDNGKERRSCETDHEKSDFFECKNRNIRRNSEDCTNHEDKKSDIDIRNYIDNKFHDMEKRLMERIDEIEASTNQKLDAILERLESRLSLQ